MVFAASFGLAACVTPRVYSEQELGAVAQRCGVALGEVIQEPDHFRILFLYAPQATPPQLSCVRRWARRRNMHLAYVEAIDWVEE